MKKFSLKMPNRSQPSEWDENDIESEDFADPEREEIKALKIGESVKFADGAVMTRIADSD